MRAGLKAGMKPAQHLDAARTTISSDSKASCVLGRAASAGVCKHQQMHRKDKEEGDHAISSDGFFEGVKDGVAAEGKRTLNLRAKATCFTAKTYI